MTLSRSRPRSVSLCLRHGPGLGLLLGLFATWVTVTTTAAGPDQDLRATDATSFVLGNDSGYGSAIARAGDWMAVGAPGTATDTTSSYTGGRVFLWKHESGAWQMKQQLTWPEPDAEANPANGFGRRLALRSTRLLVGSASTLGKVHVFDLVSGVWTLTATLTPQGSDTSGAGFGDGLALSDSGTVAVIGSPTGQSEGETSPTGWLDVYEQADTTWVHRGRLTDPLHGAGLGKALTLHADTIIAGRPQSNAGTGTVAIFERSGNVWTQTQRLPQPFTYTGFGSQVLAHEGRLFVVSSGGAVHEYSLPSWNRLNTSDVDIVPSAGTPLLATDGFNLAVCSPGLSASKVTLFTRVYPNSWKKETHYLNTHTPDFDKKALGFRSGELLLGGSAPTVRHPLVGEAVSATHWTVRGVDPLRPNYNRQWLDRRQILPMTRCRLDVLEFGQSTAQEGEWLVVGAPDSVVDSRLINGFVSVYRRTAQGSLQFHSFLPEPTVRGMGNPGFGRQVSISGGRIAVGHVEDQDLNVYCVLIYAWDAAQQRWLLEATVSPPEDTRLYGYDFGSALSLKGDLLAVGASEDACVFLYRRTGTEWTLEARLDAPEQDEYDYEFFGKHVSLSGTSLLVGSRKEWDNDLDAAYFFELKKGIWTRVARFTRPASQKFGDFATCVGLDGDRAIVGCDGPFSPGSMYVRSAGVWKHHMDLPSGGSSGGIVPSSACLSGTTAIVTGSYAPNLHTFTGGKWTRVFGDFAEGMYRGFSMADGVLVGGALEGIVQVRRLSRGPKVYLSADAVSMSTESVVQEVDLGEYLVGSKMERAVTFHLLHQGTAPVRTTATLSGDVADFTLSAATWNLALGKWVEPYLRFTPKTTGPKELTVSFAADSSHDQPSVIIIRAQVVAVAQPVTFLRQPQSQLQIGDRFLRTLYVTVQGTRPFNYRWTRNGTTVAGHNRSSIGSGDGGLYQVEVTSPAGKFPSERAAVGWAALKTYRVVTPQGQIAQEELQTLGPVKIRWCKTTEGGALQPLTDGGRLSGTTKPLLKISKSQPEDTGRYVAQITMDLPAGGSSTGEIPADLYVVRPLLATLSVPSDHILPLGATATLQCGFQFDGPTDYYVPSYTITGLPPGLSEALFTKGKITGKPTKAGLYNIKVTAKLGPFTSAPLVTQIVVQEDYRPTPGLYWGWIPRSSEFAQAGYISMDLRPDGTASGTLQTGAQRTSFSCLFGPSWSGFSRSNIFRLTHRFYGGSHTATLKQPAAGDDLEFWVDQENVPGGGQVTYVLTSLQLIKRLVPALAPPPEVLGRHSVAMLGSGSTADPHPSIPAGHSFGTLTVKADRSATLAGQLADGNTLTGAGWYSEALGTRPARLYFYAVDKTGRSSLRGTVPVPAIPDPEYEPEPEPEPEPPIEDEEAFSAQSFASASQSEPHLLWSMLPVTTSRSYPGGLQDRQIPWLTSRYDPKVPGQSLTAGAWWLWLSPYGRSGSPASFTLSSKLALAFPTGAAAHPWAPKLTFPPATGLFSGQFTLRDPDPAAPAKTLTRTVSFKGIYLPEHHRGYGHFVLPDLPDPDAIPPTKLTTSPVYSGAVEIGP